MHFCRLCVWIAGGLCLLQVMAVSQLAAQTSVEVIPLWPDGAPGFEDRSREAELAESYWVKNVHQPSLTVFLPAADKACGAAVIICPGGGHRELVFQAEGVEAAKYFNSIGVAAFALKYRLGREEGSPYTVEEHAKQDGQRAMRLVRSRAAQWGIDPTRIGMLGFSAGGEVVSLVAYAEDSANPQAADPIDRVSSRPDFQALVYPGPLGIPEQISPQAPPAFLLVANDDRGASRSVIDLLPKLRQAGVSVETHIFARGGHAFNMGKRTQLKTLATWPERLHDWMQDNFILDPAGRQAYEQELEQARIRAEQFRRRRDSQTRFENDVQPILSEYCYGCHAYGESNGGLEFEKLLASEDQHLRLETWYRVFAQIRGNLMPPSDEPQPTPEQLARLEDWIKFDGLQLDPHQYDPGRVTIRRLNRNEYRHTIRDLLGADFDTQTFFPADDTGHGFDNIGDVLSLSPLLLEKYIDAAKSVVEQVVPTAAAVVRRKIVPGSNFVRVRPPAPPPRTAAGEAASGNEAATKSRRGSSGGLELSYYEPLTARTSVEIEQTGEYALELDLAAQESYVDNIFDLNRCRFSFAMDGEELLSREFVRQGGKDFLFRFPRQLTAGRHELTATVEPLSEETQVRNLRLHLRSLTFVGPQDAKHYERPANYTRFFPSPVPDDPAAQTKYAEERLGSFAARAFRRPVPETTVEKLGELAQLTTSQGESFEQGIAQAMTAVLASPSFLFREEFPKSGDDSLYPLIDEFSLASRLSYFLWSSMPDEELSQLAEQGALRENLDQQIDRMLADAKSQAFVENFSGQWLQSRAIDSVQISARSVLRREAKPDPEADQRRRRFFELARKSEARTADEETEFSALREGFQGSFGRGPAIDLTDGIRRAMRRETELQFEHVVREDRSLLELLDCDYTFLNQELAGFYEIEGVTGEAMRRVELAPDSIRGGVLTSGTTLVVTSNPDRTSPVKRGLFVLENLLGIPTAAPPPDIPSLEEAAGERDASQPLSLRETLALHRAHDACSSCHNRMDPLGLALENFNALGRYREQEFGVPIEPAGVLISGEAFADVRQLKKTLASDRKVDFYRCATEKLLTYALGRAVEYTDVLTVDQIVDSLVANNGSGAAWVRDVVHSTPFQRMRRATNP